MKTTICKIWKARNWEGWQLLLFPSFKRHTVNIYQLLPWNTNKAKYAVVKMYTNMAARTTFSNQLSSRYAGLQTPSSSAVQIDIFPTLSVYWYHSMNKPKSAKSPFMPISQLSDVAFKMPSNSQVFRPNKSQQFGAKQWLVVSNWALYPCLTFLRVKHTHYTWLRLQAASSSLAMIILPLPASAGLTGLEPLRFFTGTVGTLWGKTWGCQRQPWSNSVSLQSRGDLEN